MGKKDKKKGSGAAKTAAKTEKKANLKLKKELVAKGEEDFDTLLAKFAAEDAALNTVKEEVVSPPGRRSCFTLTPHPSQDQLILFGGEYFNGSKTMMYNDLFLYHIKHDRWVQVLGPHSPPPRSGHQAVAVARGGGQLWIFGGEFSSVTQSHFYHFKDLWVFHLSENKWEKVTAGGGPSARSGHRMTALGNQLLVFGGFHDNGIHFRYHNDLYLFSLDDRKWTKLAVVGNGPCPRSGCLLTPVPNGGVLLGGGYSKETAKKDEEKGVTHTDMFLLTPEKHDKSGNRWKWQSVRQSGVRPSPRCGASLAAGTGERAYIFGGVYDQEDEDDDEGGLKGTFYNDLFLLDLKKVAWHTGCLLLFTPPAPPEKNWRRRIRASNFIEAVLARVTVSGKKGESEKKNRRKKKDHGEEESDEEMEEKMESLKVAEEAKKKVVSDDGVFTVTVGPSSSAGGQASSNQTNTGVSYPEVFVPPPRMNAGVAVKRGTLYLYGGMFEDNHKQLTLNDFYALVAGSHLN
ncbi:hypothetical protein O3P69_010516 [Scylla paramamosain]|uniref:Kelch domain-containing protein 4 n=1 Tax=Scylla paramamosain TaxID=85552 RepID=A0AAW0TTM9_SCYPA